MESLEVHGKTVEEAIQQALDQLGVGREEVEVSVVRENKPGILGIGAEDAVVRVTPITMTENEEKDIEVTTRDILERLLSILDLEGSITLQTEPIVDEGIDTANSMVFNITGDDLGILIGRRGQTLSCFQYIVRLIVGHQTKSWAPIVIDVEGYKRRRYNTLQVFARDMAEQVKARKTTFTFEPMSAYERRIIHLALADETDVVTESIGQGEARRVVIQPRKR